LASKKQFSLIHELRQELSRIPDSFSVVPIDEDFSLGLLFSGTSVSYATDFPQPIKIAKNQKEDSIVLVTNLNYWRYWKRDKFSGFHFPSLLQSSVLIVDMDNFWTVEPIIAFVLSENPNTEYLLFLSKLNWEEQDLEIFHRNQQKIMALRYLDNIRITIYPLELFPNTARGSSNPIVSLPTLASLVKSSVLDQSKTDEDFATPSSSLNNSQNGTAPGLEEDLETEHETEHTRHVTFQEDLDAGGPEFQRENEDDNNALQSNDNLTYFDFNNDLVNHDETTVDLNNDGNQG